MLFGFESCSCVCEWIFLLNVIRPKPYKIKQSVNPKMGNKNVLVDDLTSLCWTVAERASLSIRWVNLLLLSLVDQSFNDSQSELLDSNFDCGCFRRVELIEFYCIMKCEKFARSPPKLIQNWYDNLPNLVVNELFNLKQMRLKSHVFKQESS